MGINIKGAALVVAAAGLVAGGVVIGRSGIEIGRSEAIATHNPNLVGEWMVDGWAYAVWFYANGSGISKTEINDGNKGQPTLTRRFRWETRQESVVISAVSGDELPAASGAPGWPPKAGEYPFTYRGGTSVPGSAFLTLMGGSSAWAFERR